MAGSSEELIQEIYDSAFVARYRRSSSRIKNFKVNDRFDQFVFNIISAIAEIIPTKAKDALSIDDLDDILSDFPQVDELFRMPNSRDKLGLPVTTLICLLEMHGHLPHPETILDPLELTDKEASSVRERSGLLLLHLCGETERNLHRYVARWRMKTEENMKEIRAMYGVTPRRGEQVTFASPQSYEMTHRIPSRLSSSEQIDNTPVHPGVDVGRRVPF